MRRFIFITGSTGFFGIRLLREILTFTRAHLFLLVRAGRGQDPRIRLKAALEKVFAGQKIEDILKRITIVEGNLTKKDLGIKKFELKEIAGKIDTIFHCAAIADLYLPIGKIRRVNVSGTRNLLDFASLCRKKGPLKKISHISTAYVVGAKGMSEIIFYEDQLDIAQDFNNPYEQSKYEAELVAEEFRGKGLAVDIFRPSIMIEDLPVKDPQAFGPFFRPFRFLVCGIFREIPASDDTEYNLIPAGAAARAIFLISESTDGRGRNYHVVNSVQVRFGRILDIAQKVFGVRRPLCIPLEEFKMKNLTGVQKKLIEPFIPYFNFKARFDCRNARGVLKDKGFSCEHLKDEEIESVFLSLRGKNVAVKG